MMREPMAPSILARRDPRPSKIREFRKEMHVDWAIESSWHRRRVQRAYRSACKALIRRLGMEHLDDVLIPEPPCLYSW
jgi:hypothetical protein